MAPPTIPQRPSKREASPSPARFPAAAGPSSSEPSDSEKVNGWACVVNKNWDPKKNNALPKGLVPSLKVNQGEEDGYLLKSFRRVKKVSSLFLSSFRKLVVLDRDKWLLRSPKTFFRGRFPPEIGRNSELEKLRSLAIKIQWLPEGETKWKQYYLERQRLWEDISPTEPTLVTYANAPSWVYATPPAKVYFLRYDHLNQKRVLEGVRYRNLTWPRDNTMEENKRRLIGMFPPDQNRDVIIGPKPGPRFLLQNRNTCDLCLSQRGTTACNYDAQDNSCQCCRSLHRPCTWSKGVGIISRMVFQEPLEELGIAVNVSRNEGSLITILEDPPFHPEVELEDHAQLLEV
ncbi:hypothetical protein FHETE_156 [Fusarium heterosporum]|uniref:Uncharacterized protein n=1 Tax=Fusarium heterosporum TaxID=42747 RepID=A0A8H5U1F0_FUSHE|nr:hypothetical protein FHETE_156 [Fusarium heterosporum]